MVSSLPHTFLGTTLKSPNLLPMTHLSGGQSYDSHAKGGLRAEYKFTGRQTATLETLYPAPPYVFLSHIYSPRRQSHCRERDRQLWGPSKPQTATKPKQPVITFDYLTHGWNKWLTRNPVKPVNKPPATCSKTAGLLLMLGYRHPRKYGGTEAGSGRVRHQDRRAFPLRAGLVSSKVRALIMARQIVWAHTITAFIFCAWYFP